jgi:hypothetical protein
MGTTLWVLGRKSVDDGDDYDHSAMFDGADELDALCAKLGVAKLSSFFDWADFNANMGDEGDDAKAQWHDPKQALPVLRALRERVAADGGDAQLLEELDDCVGKVAALADRGEQFHLCVVM